MKLYSIRYLSGTEQRTALIASSGYWSAFALLMATVLEPTILEAAVVS